MAQKQQNTRRATICKSLLICALCFAMLSCGGTPVASTESTTKTNDHTVVALWPASDSIKTDTMHLGRVKEGEIINSSFIVHNISSQPLVIIDVKVACGCAKATFDTSPVMPGAQRQINYTFNSSGRQGAQIKYFELQSSDEQNIKIFFDAEVI